jgi:hypothetical protein
MKEDRCHPDIGSNIEDAVSVVQLDSVLQVAPCDEDFAVNEARLIGIQRKHRKTIWETELSHHRFLDYELIGYMDTSA